MVKIHIKEFKNHLKVINITKEPVKENCYDLQVEDCAHYITNGLVSHNSLIIAGVIKALDCRTLLLVDRVNLATQIARFFSKYGIPRSNVKVLYGGQDAEKIQRFIDKNDKAIVVSTVQSVEKLGDLLKKFEVVICDECHHAKARTWVKVLKSCSNAIYRFGFSGTIFSKDEEANYFRIAYLGDQIFEQKTAELVERKVLSKPIIRVITINPVDNTFYDMLRNTDDFAKAYELGIAKNFHRNNIVVAIAKELEGKTLILFRLISHGQELKRMLPQALYVDGNTLPETRDQIFKGFNMRTRGILLLSSVGDEGIDFSAGIHNLVIASAGKSVIKVIQRLGRGLRLSDVGTVNVFDFYDKTNHHLESHALERVKIYKEEGHLVKMLTGG